MSAERATERSPGGLLEHRYGPRVHILDNLLLLTLLARMGNPATPLSELHNGLRGVYRSLLDAVVGHAFPARTARVATRMAGAHPRAGYYTGRVLDPHTKVVVADVIRAGILPAQVCFEVLSTLLPGENVRLDHLNMARKSSASGQILGVDLSGSKIGGSVEGALLLVPDPMGATGATTLRLVDHYLENYGRPAAIVTMPMIATPEYLRCVLARCDALQVFTARLDRGLSSESVLASVPGSAWDEERGLDDHGYIVPGAGGMGEVLNNSWC